MKPGPKPVTHTLESIKAMCEIDDDCWTFTGAKNLRIAQNGQRTSLRPLVYELKSRAVRVGYIVKPTCGNPRCVNPEHLRERSIAGHSADVNKDRKLSSAAKAKISAYHRKNSKLTQDVVDEIRCGEKSVNAWAKELNVSWHTIHRVSTGDTWKDYSTPWAGLMA